jgi:hypothetical protein
MFKSWLILDQHKQNSKIAEQINTGFLTLCCSSINFWTTYPDLSFLVLGILVSQLEPYESISTNDQYVTPLHLKSLCRWCSSVYKASEIPLEVCWKSWLGGTLKTTTSFKGPGSSSLINTVKKTVKKTLFIYLLTAPCF